MKKAFIGLTLISLTLLSCANAESKKDQVSYNEESNRDEVAAENEDNRPLEVVEIPDDDFGRKGNAPSTGFLNRDQNETVLGWIDYFTNKDRERFQRFIYNGQTYRGIIEEVLAKHHLPKELFFVGLIESGYYLRAKSRASAVGPWQFIKGTGVRYGLRVQRDVDERRSIYKATEAAAMYFKDLYNIFGSWELALSAYNAGENGIIRRIRNAGTNDFEELSRRNYLPSETKNYVPKVVATMHIFENAEKYGFDIPEKVPNEFEDSKEIQVSKSVSLTTIAEAAGTSVRQIKFLNPDLSANYTPRSTNAHPNFELRLPARSNVKQIAQVIRNSPEYVHQRVAQNIRKNSRYQPHKRNIASAKNKRPSTYKVRPGDNLATVAKKLGKTVAYVKRLNGLKDNDIYPGQKLRTKL